ncbi:MAG: homoprotocatechuate degradation operon regulator HpaR [Rhodobacter sp.]|nr:homoprotocatechuate degradation operon regulator HpaR [Rhodobacter sp.]
MTLPTPSDFDLRVRATSRSLPIALLRARERVMGPIRAMLADAGVTEQQWRVLRVLSEHGETDATDIAQEACLLMPSLTRILQVLEKKGFCARRIHPTDRRRTLIAITDEGRALIERNIPESNRIFAELETAYGKDRIEALLDLLADLTDPKT